MAISITEFLGYVPFYSPNGAELFRLPVFSASGTCSYIFCAASLSAEQAMLAKKVTADRIFQLCLTTGSTDKDDGAECIYCASNGYGVGFVAEYDSLYCKFTLDKLVKSDITGTIWESPLSSEYIFLVKRGTGYVTASISPDSYEANVYNASDGVGISMPGVAILPDPELPEPDRIDIVPSPAFCGTGESIQFTGFFNYGDERVEASGGWSVEDIGTSDISISDSGLLSIGSFVDVAYFNVKLTWLGSSYNLSKTARVTIGTGAYDPGGTSSGNIGGNGYFDGPGGSWGDGIGPAPSTDITADVPNGSSEANSSSTGLFTRYAMNGSDLFTLGSALYVENILANIGKEIMSFLWNSPNEALISLISYPFDVTSLINTTSSGIKFGSLELDAVTGNRLNGTFAQIDWGTIKLSEYWGNFLDYAPHTKIELYLPWCTGSVSIDPHEVLPGSIRVITNIEISKGTCVHNVLGNKGAVIGTYSGTCGSQLPMTALDTSGKALALVTAAAGALVAGAAAGGGASAGIAAANSPHTTAMAYSLEHSRGLEPMAARLTAQREAISRAESPYRAIERRATQASLVSSVAAFRTPATIQRNGSFTGNGAGMSIQFPFVIVSRPEQNIPQNYGRFFGYPSNVYANIGSVSGYTEISSVHVNGLTGATLDEIEEVERLLKGGVIL